MSQSAVILNALAVGTRPWVITAMLVFSTRVSVILLLYDSSVNKKLILGK